MGRFANGWALTVVGWACFALITGFAVYGLPESLSKAVEVLTGP